MIPKIYVNDSHAYPHFVGPFGIAPALVPNGFPAEASVGLVQNGIEIAPSANIESIIQAHRRKMLRRAANRRSAQLSRARKKAHLEELKAENLRLQRLVDVLDSQPELVFCVTTSGRLTYVPERTINFVKINFLGDDPDEDPVHISQILTKESCDDLLETLSRLQSFSAESDLHMLFSVKEVNFHDSFGHPMVGFLRVAKVQRRSSLQDLQTAESLAASSSGPPPAKKPKRNSSSSNTSSSAGLERDEREDGSREGAAAGSGSAPTGEGEKDWNMSKFHILADYAAHFEEREGDGEVGRSQPSTRGANGKEEKKRRQSSETKEERDLDREIREEDQEDEFVCVMRTSDDCFVAHRAHPDLLLFSSLLSAASIQAHDLEFRGGRQRGSSPSDSQTGNGQSSSSSGQKNSTSSEAGSEDNNNETDSN